MIVRTRAADRSGPDQFRLVSISYFWENSAPSVMPAAPSTASPKTVLRDQKLPAGLESSYSCTKASWEIRERRTGNS